MKSEYLLAIDPGSKESGYVVVEHDKNEIIGVIDKGKVDNSRLYKVIAECEGGNMAIEMIASYGMAVGKSVFDTCVWIGRFLEWADKWELKYQYVYRKDEKMALCNSMKAKDSNIKQSLIDRYAPDTSNHGKGTKKEPGFFYGFKADIWQAFAVAVTYFDTYKKSGGETK